MSVGHRCKVYDKLQSKINSNSSFIDNEIKSSINFLNNSEKDKKNIESPKVNKATETTYLNRPLDMGLKEAKSFGAEWNSDFKAWQVTEGTDLTPFLGLFVHICG